ncbi:hypothetical protein INR35_26230, partial [Escherichia coli]|nr:hypothetical protein [Escherichia coli]
WSGYGLLHYGSFDFIAWVAVLLLGSGMAEAVMPMMMLNNLVARLMITLSHIFRTLAGEHENNRSKRQYPQRRDCQPPVQPEQ